MNRQDKGRAGLLAGVKAGHLQAATDRRLAADAVHAGDVALLPLDAVLGRLGGLDTREPTPEALDALAESLEALGLLEPLVVDRVGRLLAGKTRLLALRRLAAKDPARWKLVPVRRMDFDAEAAPARALAVEVAENEQRRDYTPAEVRGLAARLQAAGFKATPGRPRKGEKALVPALAAVVGKSKRQLLRIIAPAAVDVEAGPSATFADACARLRRALGTFERAAADLAQPGGADGSRALEDAAKLARLLDRLEKKEGSHAD
jgi:ParB family chromosome partitioning protein